MSALIIACRPASEKVRVVMYRGSDDSNLISSLGANSPSSASAPKSAVPIWRVLRHDVKPPARVATAGAREASARDTMVRSMAVLVRLNYCGCLAFIWLPKVFCIIKSHKTYGVQFENNHKYTHRE